MLETQTACAAVDACSRPIVAAELFRIRAATARHREARLSWQPVPARALIFPKPRARLLRQKAPLPDRSLFVPIWPQAMFPVKHELAAGLLRFPRQRIFIPRVRLSSM